MSQENVKKTFTEAETQELMANAVKADRARAEAERKAEAASHPTGEKPGLLDRINYLHAGVAAVVGAAAAATAVYFFGPCHSDSEAE